MTITRNRSFGGMSLGFPPFRGAVKWLVLLNAGIFLFLLVADIVFPATRSLATQFFGLTPALVLRGAVWQLATYSFFHSGLMHLLFNMLGLWMFGATLESDWGRKSFLQFFFFCVVGAALATVAISYIGLGMAQLATNGAWSSAGFWQSMASLVITPTIGASGGVYGILMAFGVLYGEQQVMMFPLPFLIKAKYMVAIIVFLVLVSTLQPGPGGVANIAHLGGLVFGYAYVKIFGRRGVGFAASERYYGLRNAYFKWKRRRAGRKFEVYMRQHDKKQFFDEYGNYKGPEGDDPKKGNGESRRPPWVN